MFTFCAFWIIMLLMDRNITTHQEAAVFDDSVLRSQQCAGFKSWDQIDPAKWLLEPKLDGFRLIALVGDGKVKSFTRSMKSQDGKLPVVEAHLAEMFPPGTVVDGEVCSLKADGRGNDFEHVQSVMLSGAETAARKDAARPLQYLLFDMTFDGGVDIRQLPLHERRARLQRHVGAGTDRVAVLIAMPATEETHDALVALDWEGSVVKRLDSTYSNGDRNRDWIKIKAQPEVDVIIMGYAAGRGKFEGQVGAVEFGQPNGDGELVKRGQCSGMDDAQRKYMTDNMDELLGTVITIKPFGTLGKGLKFRMPQFDRFRPDKPATEVTWHDK